MPSGIYKHKKGYNLTSEHRKKLSEAKKRNPPKNLFQKRDNHPRWIKGKISYLAVHKWLYREFGLANKCEYKNCIYPRKNANNKLLEKPKRFDWANISSLYKRERSDWIMLCPSCHAKFDRNLINL